MDLERTALALAAVFPPRQRAPIAPFPLRVRATAVRPVPDENPQEPEGRFEVPVELLGGSDR